MSEGQDEVNTWAAEYDDAYNGQIRRGMARHILLRKESNMKGIKGITVTAAAGLLIASFVFPGTSSAKGPKLTLPGVEAQVVTLQAQVATLQTTVNSLHPPVFAVVDSDGTLVRGSSSVVSASRTGSSSGNYQVIFNKDVTGCGFVATIGQIGSSGVALPGAISVAGLSANPVNGVFIQTTGFDGSSSDRPFHLSVVCP